MKATDLPDNFRNIIKNTANKLSGPSRRKYLAEVTIEFFGGNCRKAERSFGWGRKTIEKGIRELQTGIVCLDAYSFRGNKKTEEKNPKLMYDIRSILNTNHLFFNKKPNRRVNPRNLRQALIIEKGYADDQLPCEKTLSNILCRTGLIRGKYSLGSRQKSQGHAEIQH